MIHVFGMVWVIPKACFLLPRVPSALRSGVKADKTKRAVHVFVCLFFVFCPPPPAAALPSCVLIRGGEGGGGAHWIGFFLFSPYTRFVYLNGDWSIAAVSTLQSAVGPSVGRSVGELVRSAFIIVDTI